MRTGRSETIDMSPYFVNFGREIILSGLHYCLPLAHEDTETSTPSDESDRKSNILEKIFRDVECQIAKAQETSTQTYNLQRDVRYVVGQQIWRKNCVLSDGSKYFTAKFAPRYVGPLPMKKIISSFYLTENNIKKVRYCVIDMGFRIAILLG